MAIKLIIDRCNVKGIRSWTSDKSGKTYDSLVLACGVDDMEIGCGDFDLSKVPTMVPMSVEAEISVRRIGTRQNVEFIGKEGPVFTPV